MGRERGRGRREKERKEQGKGRSEEKGGGREKEADSPYQSYFHSGATGSYIMLTEPMHTGESPRPNHYAFWNFRPPLSLGDFDRPL